MQYLWIGRSGHPYQQRLRCAVPQDEAARIVTRFFLSRGATLCEGDNNPHLTFTRGCTWHSRWAWLQPCFDRWPDQRITVEFPPQPPAVNLCYDVRVLFCRACTPDALAHEARELEELLQSR